MIEKETTEVVYSKMGTSRDTAFETIDTKFNYTQPKYREIEGRGETLLPACWEFLTFNCVFVLSTFFFFQWGFKLLRKTRFK